ncbi:hypothetical protein LEP1GSC018_3207 [Leptospira kirschneri str. 2008720114]|nr:hypothetical protein LEP1GSC018_3207 [Leptospira kirschneri str. 2008720114]
MLSLNQPYDSKQSFKLLHRIYKYTLEFLKNSIVQLTKLLQSTVSIK